MKRLVIAVFVVACRSRAEEHATSDASAVALAVASTNDVNVELAPAWP